MVIFVIRLKEGGPEVKARMRDFAAKYKGGKLSRFYVGPEGPVAHIKARSVEVDFLERDISFDKNVVEYYHIFS